MDMFTHYYDEDESLRADFEEREREIIWSVHDFADCCEDHGFLEMMRRLTDELERRKLRSKE